jgi:4-hydroxybenzoate polyprenyltransferase/phosphoserine phosphatase
LSLSLSPTLVDGEPPAESVLAELCDDDALARPLCVNLERTILVTDTLWESVLLLLRRAPWLVFALPFWMLRGRARFKRAVAERVSLDASALPYRVDLVEALRAAAAKGRAIVLSTAADARVAAAVAEHLGFFREVIASDGAQNLKAGEKRITLETRFALSFDYIGDSAADLTVLAAAVRGYLVAASPSVARRAQALGGKVKIHSLRPSPWRALVRALRLHQWAKNALVVVPVVLAPGLPSFRLLLAGAIAALSFSLCASAGYVFNDVMDVEADRAHRTKRHRPFASGALSVLYGPPLFFVLIAASFALALIFLPLGFFGMLAVYFAATLAYSFHLKSKLMLDVVVLAWLYTHRVMAGGIATGVHISAWLLAFSMFLFLSLAFAKRYIELQQSLDKSAQLRSRGYQTTDLQMVASMGPAAGYLAVMVFCLYIESEAVRRMYHSPTLLWFVCPVMLYWVSRIWFLANRGQMQDDPVKFALLDRVSWVCALLIAAAAAAARFS